MNIFSYPHISIVIVEDKEDLRTFIVDSLHEFGLKVLSARNGEEALLLIEQILPGRPKLSACCPKGGGQDGRQQIQTSLLLITDHNMPKLTGVDLIHKLMPRHLNICGIILMSGEIDRLPRHQLDKYCPSEIPAERIIFLPKPFLLGELLHHIRNLLHA